MSNFIIFIPHKAISDLSFKNDIVGFESSLFNSVDSYAATFKPQIKSNIKDDREEESIREYNIMIDTSIPIASSRNMYDIDTDKLTDLYNVLPKFLSEFDIKRTWPIKTNVHCWYCVSPFDTMPVPLAVHYNDKTEKFRVIGLFCSFSCVRWI